MAVLIMPGAMLARRLGLGPSGLIELPALALSLSVGSAGVFAAVAWLAGLPASAVAAAMFSFTLWAARVRAPAAVAPDARLETADKVAFALFAAIGVLFVAFAVAAPNIARDRMWYSGWIAVLAERDAVIWTEPFFGTDFVPARFAHNAWIAALAAVARIAPRPAPEIFEVVVPAIAATSVVGALRMSGRVLFAGGGAGYRGSLAALSGLLLLLTTRYPFFSPERYPPFGRLAEDKFVALLIALPVVVALVVDMCAAPADTEKTRRYGVALALGAIAVAASHAIVALVMLGTLVPWLGLTALRSRAESRPQTRAAVVAAAVLLLACAGPGLSALSARSQIVESNAPGVIMEADPRHPVVRSHLRMERLREIGSGGPIVEPALVSEPLLMAALAGTAVAAARLGTTWAPLLLSASLIHLSLAFLPWLSPAFGRAVVPWMAYRALWGVPFAWLLGALLVFIVERLSPLNDDGERRAHPLPLAIVAVALILATAIQMPWQRFAPSTGKLAPDAPTRAMLGEIAALAPNTRVAAAPAFAELVPGYTGRAVLAAADRTTIALLGSRRLAERRLAAAAVITGLGPGSSRLRRRALAQYDITHTVLVARRCDPGAGELARHGELVLCAERYWRGRRFRPRRSDAVGLVPGGRALAGLADGWKCEPAGAWQERAAAYRWSRSARWSARPVGTRCRAEFTTPQTVEDLVVGLSLPRASEALVYRVKIRDANGDRAKKQGVLRFRENPAGTIPLPRTQARRVSVTLLPAHLPYLNLAQLELRGGGPVLSP